MKDNFDLVSLAHLPELQGECGCVWLVPGLLWCRIRRLLREGQDWRDQREGEREQIVKAILTHGRESFEGTRENRNSCGCTV